MLTLYFLRHGQTDWNAEARLQGQLDIPLNETGRAQARRNGAVLARLIADPATLDFVASPLVRATETMEIVRIALGLPPQGYRTEPALREIHFGLWQGRTWAKLKADDAEAVAARAADPWSWIAPGEGGESLAMVQERVCVWLAGIRRDTVIVAHGGVKRCLRRHIERLSPADALRLEVPQDKVMVVRDGMIELI